MIGSLALATDLIVQGSFRKLVNCHVHIVVGTFLDAGDRKRDPQFLGIYNPYCSLRDHLGRVWVCLPGAVTSRNFYRKEAVPSGFGYRVGMGM